MTEPRKYTPRHIEVEAMKLTQYGDFVRARDWVNNSGGEVSAYFLEKGVAMSDQLILVYSDTTKHVYVGSYVVKSPAGSFVALTAAEFEAAYDLVPEAPQSDTVSATGHVSKPVDTSRTHSGGAALSIPRLPAR